MSRPWMHKESLFLAQTHERCGIPWCASELRRTVEECVQKLRELGTPEGGEWLTPGEAGRLASCCSATIRSLALTGKIEGRKADGFWQISRESVLAYADAHQRAAEDSGLERPHYVRPRKSPKTREKASERPNFASEGVSAEPPTPERSDAATGLLEAKNGSSPEEAGPPEGFMTVEAFAEACGIARKTALRKCWDRRVSCRKWHGRWFISCDEAVMAQPREKPEPDRCVSKETLADMSRLDVLKALASGAMIGGIRG